MNQTVPVTPTDPVGASPLADICAQCERSVHPEDCPTAYRTCPLMPEPR